MTTYVSYTYLDALTGETFNQNTSRGGPVAPAGCVFDFEAESLRPTPTPTFYGTTMGRTDIPGILAKLTKTEFDAAKADEMAAREAKRLDAFPTISDRQFAEVLADEGKITDEEAIAWAARGDLPATLTDALAQIPEEDRQRFKAQMLLAGAIEYRRSNPLVGLLAAILGYQAEEVDALWLRAAAL